MRSVGAVLLYVQEIERVKTFLRDTLGLHLFDSKGDWAGFKLGEVLIELFGPGAAGLDVGASGSPGIKGRDQQPLRLSFKVKNIEAEVARLKEKGVRLVTPVGEERWGKYVWFVDPEGNQYQLWEPAKK